MFPDEPETMANVPGLLYLTWIHAGARLGSYQVFTDRSAAEHYLGGKFFRRVRANAAFSDFEIRHFEVVGQVASFSGDPYDAASGQQTARPIG
jgi:hypothetical protein